MRGVMLHPVRVPPASGSLPPSDVPSGDTLGSITGRSHKCPTDMQLPRQPQVRLVSTRILRPPHAARPAGRRNPPPRFRSASPPPGSPPTPNPRRSSAPRPAASCFVPHIMPPAPRRIPSRRGKNCASGTSFVSSTSEARAATSGRYGVKCCPRHSRRFRTPIVVCAAWSFLRDHLTPRPAVAKSTYRFCVRKIRCEPALQNNGNGAGELPQSSGAGRSRLGKHGSSRHLLAAWFVASIRHPHSTPAIPRPWPQRRGVSQNSSPRTARPHPRSTEPSGLPLEVLLFKRERTLPSRLPLAVKTALRNDGWRKKAGANARFDAE